MGFKNCFSYLYISNSIKEILKYSLCTGETGRDCYMAVLTSSELCSSACCNACKTHSIVKDTAAINRSFVMN